jgi:hypothetical protein
MLSFLKDAGLGAIWIPISELAAITAFGITFYMHKPLLETVLAPIVTGALTFSIPHMLIGRSTRRQSVRKAFAPTYRSPIDCRLT